MAISVVAVHGLSGHSIETWTAPNGVQWLKELLPLRVRAARIISYGYDAKTHGHERLSQSSIGTQARELLRALTLLRDETNVIF